MDDDVVFFAMVQRYNIYFKYVSLHHDILGSHGAKSSTENIYWANLIRYSDMPFYEDMWPRFLPNYVVSISRMTNNLRKIIVFIQISNRH